MMKNKKLLIFISVAVLACVVYVFAAAMPLGKAIQKFNSEIKLLDSKITVADTYKANAAQFEERITQLQASLDDIYAVLAVNEDSVYENLGELCEQYSIMLDSIETDKSSESGDYVIYPITLSIVGLSADITSFIEYLEGVPGGSYVINSVSMGGTEGSATAILEISLYCPAND